MIEKRLIYMRLDDRDYRDLDEGKIVEREVEGATIKLILADIGFDRMFEHIAEARRSVEDRL